MLMHGPMIFYVLDYRSVSTFHRQSRYGAKYLSFFAVEAVDHTWQNAVWRLSTSIHTAHNVLASESFLTLSNVLKQLTHQLVILVFPSSASVWDRSSSSISSNSFSSHFFGYIKNWKLPQQQFSWQKDFFLMRITIVWGILRYNALLQHFQ